MKKLFTPGPTNIPNFILDELSKNIIHHRTEDYSILLKNVIEKLKEVYKTDQDVIIMTTSGTGAMEASVINLFKSREKVLVINTGFFGERYTQITNIYNLEVIELKYQWGRSYNLNEIKETIRNNPDLKGIFVTHNETSTGVCNNIKDIGELTKGTNILLVVDSISGIVNNELLFDDWNIDCAVSASQKGFLLPPGLSFACLSSKAINKMNELENRGYYLNFKKYLQNQEIGQNPYTPAVSLVMALKVALEYLLEKEISYITSKKREERISLERKLQELGFNLFIEDEKNRGNSLVVVSHENIDIEQLIKLLDRDFDITIANGQGKYKNKLIRIGLLGDYKDEDYNELLNAIQIKMGEIK